MNINKTLIFECQEPYADIADMFSQLRDSNGWDDHMIMAKFIRDWFIENDIPENTEITSCNYENPYACGEQTLEIEFSYDTEFKIE